MFFGVEKHASNTEAAVEPKESFNQSKGSVTVFDRRTLALAPPPPQPYPRQQLSQKKMRFSPTHLSHTEGSMSSARVRSPSTHLAVVKVPQLHGPVVSPGQQPPLGRVESHTAYLRGAVRFAKSVDESLFFPPAHHRPC